MITVFDIETSYQVIDGKKDPSPKHTDNFIVSIGSNDEYFLFKHAKYNRPKYKKEIKKILNDKTIYDEKKIKCNII